MNTIRRETVVGVFEKREHAQSALRDLRSAGFREDQIGLVTRHEDTHHDERVREERGSKAPEGAGVGALAGAGLGGLWAVGIAAGMLPAVGPVIAGGIFASILASAAGGAAAGGLVGALIGLGIPEEEAEYYRGEFEAGRTIVTVKDAARSDEAWSILSRHGAYDANRRTATGSRTTTATRRTGSEDQRTIERREEELHPHKSAQKTGEVQVRKDVVTEHQHVDVPVTREEVVVERQPASDRSHDAQIRDGEEIRIPVSEEHVDVEKRTVAKENVKVGKRAVQDTESVDADLKKERVKVDREGRADVRSESKRR